MSWNSSPSPYIRLEQLSAWNKTAFAFQKWLLPSFEHSPSFEFYLVCYGHFVSKTCCCKETYHSSFRLVLLLRKHKQLNCRHSMPEPFMLFVKIFLVLFGFKSLKNLVLNLYLFYRFVYIIEHYQAIHIRKASAKYEC